MLGVEQIALNSELCLSTSGLVWTCNEDWPHISTFHYELGRYHEDSGELMALGTVDGYRIAQDSSIEDELRLWDEADALDGDVVRYVEALIRELRACNLLFDGFSDVTSAQRITIVGHVEAKRKASLPKITQAAVACLAAMDAPVFMLVDPWPMADEREAASGKLKGRGNIRKLLEIGFQRMVASRFVWAWNRELGETLMSTYSYNALLAAKKRGALEVVLKSALADEVYGAMTNEIARAVDVPQPDDLMDE